MEVQENPETNAIRMPIVSALGPVSPVLTEKNTAPAVDLIRPERIS